MNFWKALQLGGFILGWLERSARDGRITLDELVELVSQAAVVIGIKVDIEVPAPDAPALSVKVAETE